MVAPAGEGQRMTSKPSHLNRELGMRERGGRQCIDVWLISTQEGQRTPHTILLSSSRLLHVTRGWHGSVFLGTCPTTVLVHSAPFNTLWELTAWHYACSKCSRLLWYPLLGHPGLDAPTWLLGKDSGYRNHTPSTSTSTSTSTSELWPLWLGPTHWRRKQNLIFYNKMK